MLGVMFGKKHSYYDLGIWLTKYPEISPPTPKTSFVDVPGMDGALNLSKVLTGHTMYNRRTMQLEFAILAPRVMWPDVHSEIMDTLHGQEMSIILDDDPEYMYTGTLAVQAYDPGKVTSGVTITADLDPYKKRLKDTIKSFTVNGSKEATIRVERMPTVPVIAASAAMTMTFGGKSYSLTAGANEFDDVILRHDQVNAFTFTGSGDVSLSYREGRF
jgi:phage-related protein